MTQESTQIAHFSPDEAGVCIFSDYSKLPIDTNNPQNMPVAGVIKRVSLKNFMCHANFELTFGPRLNFIIGHNGSGKSSILTAISVCLGAKATETNRGNNLRDLIKEGTNVAQVRVVLSNKGNDAFEPEKYGSEITIERTIRRDTTSAPYSLRSETGKKVSSKKTDLDAILDTFNIGVSNPMTFLSQDQARSFLTASSDADKYKHFMRGTLMEEIVQNLKKVNETTEQIDSKLIRMKDSTRALKDRSREARRLHDQLKASDELRDKQVLYHGKYFWLEYEKSVQVLSKSAEEVESLREHINELGENIQAIKENIRNVEVKMKHLEHKTAEFTQQLKDARSEYDEQKQATREATTKTERLVQKLDGINREIEKFNKIIVSLEHRAKKEEEKIRLKNGGSKEVLQQQLRDLSTEGESLEERVKQLNEELDNVKTLSTSSFEQINTEIIDKAEQLKDLEHQHRAMSASKQYDPLATYPDQVKAVVEQLKRHRFSDKVTGPMGAYISVNPVFQQWARLIDAQLGRTSMTFIVRNSSDQQQLKKIMDHCGCRSTILIRRPEVFDYSSGCPGQPYLTILDCLEFSDEDVKYALIDLAHVEGIVLCNDRHEAQGAVERGPPSVRLAMSPKNDRECTAQYKNRNGAFISDVLYFDRMARIFVKNAMIDTKPIELQRSALKSEYEELKRQKKLLAENQQQQITAIQAKIRDAGTRKRAIGSRIYQLEKTLDASDSAQLEALLLEKKETLEKKIAYENSIRDLQEQIVRSTQKAQADDEVLHALKEKAMGFKEILNKFAEDQIELDTQIRTLNKKIEHYQNEKVHHAAAIAERETNEPAWRQRAEESREEAEKMCTKEEADTVNITDLKVLKHEIEKIGEEVSKADQDLGKPPAEIIEENEVARANYAAAFDRFNKATAARQLLKTSLQKRLVAFRESRANACVRAEEDFRDSLQFRNFNGNLDFDFIKKTLKMLVSTKNDKKPRHVNSLSGGEKSFSQIALLLATWQLMRSRIKGLDEFDVFMDQVNRKIGMRLMLTKLSKEEKAQTIFITPQDIGQITELDDRFVRIHRIKDPRAKS
jgi:chromosome segregation ATPase